VKTKRAVLCFAGGVTADHAQSLSAGVFRAYATQLDNAAPTALAATAIHQGRAGAYRHQGLTIQELMTASASR